MIKKGEINFQVYLNIMEHLLKDYVFVKVVQVKEDKPFNLDKYEFYLIKFYHVSIKNCHNKSSQKILQDYSNVFKSKLTKLSPEKNIMHKINLIGSIPKPTYIY